MKRERNSWVLKRRERFFEWNLKEKNNNNKYILSNKIYKRERERDCLRGVGNNSSYIN